MKPALKAPGIKRLKLQYDDPLSNFAFKSNLRRYTVVTDASPVGITLPRSCGQDDCSALIEGVYLVGASANGGHGCGRVGFWASSFDMGPKSFPRRPPAMPYFETSGDAAFGGSVAVTGVTLVNWTATTADVCGKQQMAAFATNPTSSDVIVPIVFANLKRDTTVVGRCSLTLSNQR